MNGTSTIRVTMPGKGEVVLRPTDHLATGGEGSVYQKNNLIYKLFLQPERAAASGMADKIGLLSRIRHPFIISPIDVLHDAQHRMVGYYMAQADGVPLMKTFTNSWRDQNNFTDAQSAKLVENMREAVMAAHALDAVMVDGNETNYLAAGTDPRIIDVDSWQIGKHPATAIMPSVRDYHASCLDEHSDWFSWGVVSFQVFTGIHPYKGTHPSFKKGDLEARMRANASVFDSRVRLNAAVRDFACIPPRLLDWYEGVFAQGERSAPPSAFASAAPAHLTRRLRVVQAGVPGAPAANVRHERVHGFAGVVRHVSANGVAFYGAGTALQAYDLVRRQVLPSLTADEITRLFANQAALVRHGDGFVLVAKTDTGLSGRIVGGERDPVRAQTATNALPLACTRLVMFGNRLFALNPASDNGLVELELSTMGARSMLTIKTAWSGTVQSMRFFDGFAAMDCLGMPFLVVPEGDTLVMRRAAALAGYKLVNGFARGSSRLWLHGVSREDGQIYRLELGSSANGREAELLDARVVDEAEMNLAVSARGIAVGLWEDGKLTVQNTEGSSIREVADAALSREMHLFALPDGIYYTKGADVFKLTLS